MSCHGVCQLTYCSLDEQVTRDYCQHSTAGRGRHSQNKHVIIVNQYGG